MSEEQTIQQLQERLRQQAEEVLDRRLKELEKDELATKKELKEVREDLNTIKKDITRGKGIFVGFVGAGSVLGWILAKWDSIRGFFGIG